MKSAFDANDHQALEEFLYDLICEVKHAEETDLLVEVLMTIQHPSHIPRRSLSPAIPIDRPATRKQSRAG